MANKVYRIGLNHTHARWEEKKALKYQLEMLEKLNDYCGDNGLEAIGLVEWSGFCSILYQDTTLTARLKVREVV